MKQPTTFSWATCVLEADLVVSRTSRRSATDSIFNFYSLLSPVFRTTSCVGCFFWTAMLLRVFFMTSRFGIRRHFCGLGSFVRQPRRMALLRLVGSDVILTGSEAPIWKKGTVHCILLSNGCS